MAISTFAALKSKILSPYSRLAYDRTADGKGTGNLINSHWPGATPSTAAALSRASSGALRFVNSAGVQRIAQVSQANPGGTVWLCDRLSHQGGLSGTTTGAQTTNLPTAALTRYTNGLGVMMAAEIYSSVGSSVTTVATSYTNSGNTSGRTSGTYTFGGTNYNALGRMMILPLDPADVGVKSVESATIAATTSTAGNWGITLFKPLMSFPNISSGFLFIEHAILNNGGHMPQVVDDACLFFMTSQGNTQFSFDVLTVEE